MDAKIKIILLLAVTFICAMPLLAQPARPVKQFGEIDVLISSGNYTKALEECNLAIGKRIWQNADLIKLYTKMGRCYYELTMYDRAIGAYKEALALSQKKNPDIYLNLGLIFEKIDSIKEAIEAYEKTLATENGNKFEASYGLGRIYQKLGLNTKASEYYNKALAATLKKPPEIYRNLSACYEKLHKWDLAISMLDKTIEEENKVEDRIHLAFLYSLQNKYANSIDILNKVLEHDPENEQAMLQLAAAYFKTGKIQQTEALLDKITQKKPNDGLVYFLKGIVLYFDNNRESAKSELAKSAQYAQSPILKQYAKDLLDYLNTK